MAAAGVIRADSDSDFDFRSDPALCNYVHSNPDRCFYFYSDSDPDPLASLLRQLLCPLCRGYFRDPMVAICGHNFCRACISRHWERCRDSFPCPVCRAASPEIQLRPNRQLRNAVESAESLAAEARASRAEVTKRKQLRSMERLSTGWTPELRYRSGRFLIWRDRLIAEAPSPCPEHQEPLKLFCSQHQRPVCVTCRDQPQHRGHDFLPIQTTIQQSQETFVAHLERLRKEREKLRRWKAVGKMYLEEKQAERQKIVAEFQQLRHFLEEQEQRLLAQLQTLVDELVKHQTEGGRKLSEQISHLSERIRELEGKCEKPASEFLQDIRSTLSRCEERQAQQPEKMAPELEKRVRDFSQQTAALSESLRVFRDTLPAALVSHTKHSPAYVTLDPHTAHPELILSEDGKRVRWEQTRQPRPNTPERFDTEPCLLGREGFTSGRHYWEVEVGGAGRDCAVGVARESVSRKGAMRLSPNNGIWAVRQWCGEFKGLTEPATLLPSSLPRRIRICLDCDWGQVTFIDAGAEAPIFTFPLGSLPGERIRPWIWVGDRKTELRLCS